MDTPRSLSATALTWGAVSFVNAIPAGIGASAAIRLSCTCRVLVERAPRDEGITLSLSGERASPFLRQVLAKTAGATEERGGLRVVAHIDSQIPPGKGLKSSSAVSTCLAKSVAVALRHPLAEEALARISAEAAVETSTSVTGAFDDALTSVAGGVVVSNVREMRRLRADALPADLRSVLWVPRKEHPSTSDLRALFSGVKEDATEAVRLAIAGRFFEAMRLNTQLVERALGYDYAQLHALGKEGGALASGVSGNGPALAFVVPLAKVPAVVRRLPTEGAEVISAGFIPGPSASHE